MHQNQDTLHFKSALYKRLHERCDIIASFAKHLESQEQMLFIHTLWVNSDKSKENNQNQDNLHFENALYRVLHERSSITASFTEHLKFLEILTFTYMHFQLIVANKNKRNRMSTFYILKALYTVCSMNKAISLFPSWST